MPQSQQPPSDTLPDNDTRWDRNENDQWDLCEFDQETGLWETAPDFDPIDWF
jgi:hypothetical protein